MVPNNFRSSAGKWNSKWVKGSMSMREGTELTRRGFMMLELMSKEGGRFHGVMVFRVSLDISGSHFQMEIFFI